MLEELLIFTRGGLILWALSGGGGGKGSPVDALIRNCLLEERSAGGDGPGFFQDGKHALKWAFHNGLGLVFVAVYRRVLRLLYVDDLLAAVRAEFARVYHPKRTTYDGFGDVFRQLHLEAQARAEEMSRANNKQKPVDAASPHRRPRPQPPVVHNSPGDSESDGNGGNGDGSKKDSSDGVSGEKEEEKEDGQAFDLSFFSNLRTRFTHRNKDKTNTNKPIKKDVNKRKNPRDGNNNEHSDRKLDFSDPTDASKQTDNARVNQGQSKVDLAETVEDGTRTKGWFSSVFQSIAGGNSVIERSDLQPALKALKDRLMTKNVAEEIAEKLCESVAASLEGKKQGSFTSTASTVQAAMEAALVRILTPSRSIDVLRDVHAAKDSGRPYVIVFVGVNGVGKSTNLAKVAYWLLQHDLTVTLAACDTFRSGAVEQLRTHARRLQIPVFEKGYQRDPAVVAKQAIEEAARSRSDVVLVDTAGRMQDNEPLMRALSKLIAVNSPDLVLFVGEALVGNDAVDQLTQFNQKLADLSPVPGAEKRLIDGILLSKFDTVDDKVGAALSMVYVSGAPVMFVGCGQSYTDLKKLNVKSIVNTLLK